MGSGRRAQREAGRGVNFARWLEPRRLILSFAFAISCMLIFTNRSSDLGVSPKARRMDDICPHGVEEKDISQFLSIQDVNSPHVRLDTMNVVLIFDMPSKDHAISLMRSMMAVSTRQLQFHLIVPKETSEAVLAAPFIPPNGTMSFYEMSRCEELVESIRPFVDKEAHLAVLCKLFLGEILPPGLQKALVLDTDMSAVQDFTPCYDVDMEESQMIGMVPDTGDGCIFQPDWCWPMAFETNTPPGLTCKVFSSYFNEWWPKSFFWRLRNPVCSCRHERSCWSEPVYFNGGVVLMDLGKMRKRRFTEELVSFSSQTFSSLGKRPAKYAEQCLINNFFRLKPEILKVLPCGCNYQYSSRRKAIWCAGKAVYLTHGWSRGIEKETGDPYNRLWYYFKGGCEGCCGKPEVPTISMIDPERNFSCFTGPYLRHDKHCRHQTFQCDDIA